MQQWKGLTVGSFRMVGTLKEAKVDAGAAFVREAVTGLAAARVHLRERRMFLPRDIVCMYAGETMSEKVQQ